MEGPLPKLVLIVDDSAMIRKFMHAYFETLADFEVCGEAEDGMEAIEKTRALNPDVIILDASMPRMTGMEAAPILRSIDRHAAIILFTMHAEAVPPAAASAAGIDSVVSKSESIFELSKRVQAAVRRH